MALYTDKTKLVGEILIDPLALNDFDEVAAPIEDEIMKDLLGFELYTLLKAAPTDAKYTALLNGGSYTASNGYLTEVKGIKEMLPYFYFFYSLRNLASYNTSAGEFAAQAQNAEGAAENLTRKLVHAYNKGVDLYNQLYGFIQFKNIEEGSGYYYHWQFVPKGKINMYGI